MLLINSARNYWELKTFSNEWINEVQNLPFPHKQGRTERVQMKSACFAGVYVHGGEVFLSAMLVAIQLCYVDLHF